MFNTTIIKKGETTYVPYTKTVIEKKAPTDESIKILNEFKTKALEETMATFEVKNTEFSFVGRYTENPGNLEKRAVIKFSFNGKEYTKELNVSQRDLISPTFGSMVDWFIEKYKEMIVQLVQEAFVKPQIEEYINKMKVKQV